jgi:GTPase SAR1 family protein
VTSTDNDKRVNPFTVVHYDARPLRPLSPHEFPEHRLYYVDLDHSETEYQRFTRHFGTLPMPLEAAQPVLVTGDSGCGKSALLRRCADWLQQRLNQPDAGLHCEIIDVAWQLEDTEQLPIQTRVDLVADSLCPQLERRGLVDPSVFVELHQLRDRRFRDRANRLYEVLSTELRPDRAVIILLPSVRDLPAEVVKYIMYPLERVFFFMESALLSEDDLKWIMRRCEKVIAPIHLQVGPLNEGDAVRFVLDRFNRHAEQARFPRMSEDDLRTLAAIKWESVATLQRLFHAAYQRRLENELRYDDGQLVTLAELGQTFDWYGTDHGTAS